MVVVKGSRATSVEPSCINTAPTSVKQCKTATTTKCSPTKAQPNCSPCKKSLSKCDEEKLKEKDRHWKVPTKGQPYEETIVPAQDPSATLETETPCKGSKKTKVVKIASKIDKTNIIPRGKATSKTKSGKVVDVRRSTRTPRKVARYGDA